MSRIQCKGCDYKPSKHDTLSGYCLGCAGKMVRKYTTLKASHDKLVEALDKHGRHSKICLIQMIETHECICGFSQALKEAEKL